MRNTIITERFYLRPIENNDIDKVYEGLSDPEVILHYGVSFDSLESTKEQMEWFANLEQTGTGRWWAITSKDNHTFLGAVGYNDLSTQHRKAEIGMWLLKTHWGKATLKEVMPEVIQYGFHTLNLNRIEGYVDSENVKCKKALEKIDFQYEGTMRDCEIKNGQFVSIDIYASIASR